MECTGEYPSLIKDIVGKELNFMIEISNDNILVESKIYNVVDAYDVDFFTSSSATASTSASYGNSFSEVFFPTVLILIFDSKYSHFGIHVT